MSDLDRPDITVLPVARRRVRPRMKKLRLTLILGGLSMLALVSTVFGMMMAVASDLPALENRQEFTTAQNSQLFDVNGNYVATLSDQGRIIVPTEDIALTMQHAIIAIEDQRFYSNDGIDVRGIGRALYNDVLSRPTQGGSTITQQFVKNATQAQSRRTVFEKLREAALAYHLTRKWSKDKILTEYLNSIYFGNGAYGIEAAARTYFGADVNHIGCGSAKRRCAKELKPQEAALLAGMVASPTAYDPVVHPEASKARRDVVLFKMFQQGYLTHPEYVRAVTEQLPSPETIQRQQLRAVPPSAAYFTSWVQQQLIDKYGARKALEGGLRVQTTLDLGLQRAADKAVSMLSSPGGPTPALVAIDNDTGEVRAMIGGRNFDQSPFNLATQGQRQPGSAFKPFVLATALQRGISPDSLWVSRKQIIKVPHSTELFHVNNYDNAYEGTTTLARATTFSDNSVYAQVGIKAGTKRIAATAREMGIRTPVSTNYAITLGGLAHGVTPLDMAHSYETFATGGKLITGSLGAGRAGPIAVRSVRLRNHPGRVIDRNDPRTPQVLPRNIANETTNILQSVIKIGTARVANLGDVPAWGKTGTTENYGDAWFVGATDKLTVAVWVGYPDHLKPMLTEFRGGPVAGGTFPALIWHAFMVSAIGLEQHRTEHACALDKLRHPKLPPSQRCIDAGLAPDPTAVTPATTTTSTTPSTTTTPTRTTTTPAGTGAAPPGATPAPTDTVAGDITSGATTGAGTTGAGTPGAGTTNPATGTNPGATAPGGAGTATPGTTTSAQPAPPGATPGAAAPPTG